MALRIQLAACTLGALLCCSRGSHPPPASTTIAPHPDAPTKAVSDSIYFVLVDRFANGDHSNDGNADRSDPAGWHGGDLRGLQEQLEHIASMGFRRIWLSPIWQSQQRKFHGHGAFHGYWTTRADRIDARFGTEADLAALGHAAKRRGISLILDIVLNHVGYEASFIKDRPGWFHTFESIRDWSDSRQLEEGSVHGLPDLDQSNPAVYDFLVEATARWLSVPAVSGLRLDAVKHIGREFWDRYARDIRSLSSKDIDLIAEVFDGSPSVLATYLSRAPNSGRGFDLIFDFPLYYALIEVFCRGASPQKLAAVLSADAAYDDPTSLVTFADNHDVPRVLSQCHGDKSKVLDLISFQFSARGVPSMTYGTEADLVGESEPFNRGDMVFGKNTPVRTAVSQLLDARDRIPAFSAPRSIVLTSDPTAFVYARMDNTTAVVVAYHRRQRPLRIALPRELQDASRIVDVFLQNKPNPLVVDPGTTVLILEGDFEAVSAPQTVEVRFVISGRPDSTAATAAPMIVAGSHPAFGLWAPERGLQITGDGTTIELDAGTTVEFKIARRQGEEYVWENGSNRYVFADNNKEIRLRWRD